MTSRPPREAIESFRDRKWKETLARQASDTGTLNTVAFVTIGNSTQTTNERALSGSANVSISDGGPGSGVTLDLTNSGVTAGTYSRATVTVDSKGRVTSAASGRVSIPEYENTDPASPESGDVWVRRSFSASGGGEMEGHFGHTSAGTIGSDTYELSFRTNDGTTVRVGLS